MYTPRTKSKSFSYHILTYGAFFAMWSLGYQFMPDGPWLTELVAATIFGLSYSWLSARGG